MVIEVLTFTLRAGSEEAAFLEADERVQTEFIPNHRGFVRRTTARAADGEWLVVTLWDSLSDADASARLEEDHPVAAALAAFLDPSSIRRKRFESLD